MDPHPRRRARRALSRCLSHRVETSSSAGPSAWADRDPRFVGETAAGTIEDPIRGGSSPAMRWYTRATRDQLTGLVLGLSSAWALATAPTTDPALSALIRPVVAQIVVDVVRHLRAHGWRIRDATGQERYVCGRRRRPAAFGGARSARAVGMPDADRDYQREFARLRSEPERSAPSIATTTSQEYYAYSLRAARSYSIWLLDEDPAHRGSRWSTTPTRTGGAGPISTGTRGSRGCGSSWPDSSGRGGAARAVRAPVEAEPTLALAAGRPLESAQLQRGDPRHHGRVGASGLSAQAHGVFRLAEGAVGCRERRSGSARPG